ncbi:MAG: alpha/beta fold hydrolase [Dehalococcoidia bacterium]|nr:alpha/beta fold hydrolase [Dehalococcoidia bacterium]
MYRRLASLPHALAALLFLAGGALVACSTPAAPSRQTEPSAEPTDAHVERIETADGVGLDARLYAGSGPRLAIFMHGYGGRQQAWVPTIEALLQKLDAAALTFDFRGHGDSDQAPVDTGRLVADVTAAVAFARDHGYTSIVLIGASMGGTAAIVVAEKDPNLAGVIALSAPAQFGALDALAAIAGVEAPLALLAARGDLSAADSLRLLREEAGLPTTHSWLYDGEAHGTELLDSEQGPAVQQYVERLLREFWPAGG